MYRYIIIGLLCACFSSQAQTKKSQTKKNKPVVAQTDSIPADTAAAVVEEEPEIPRQFLVYTKRSRGKKPKLCLNLVSQDSVLNHCFNDSVLHDPEVFKILFESQNLDTTYVLVYAAAFTKDPSKPSCYAGKEVKLFFVRWNTVTNQAIIKQKSIESCMKGITNMTQEPIDQWDKQNPLIVSYHKGGSNFSEIKFDPKNYRLGLQANKQESE